jgi:hypothetical protein
LSHLHWLDATSRKEHADSSLQNAESAVHALTEGGSDRRDPAAEAAASLPALRQSEAEARRSCSI